MVFDFLRSGHCGGRLGFSESMFCIWASGKKVLRKENCDYMCIFEFIMGLTKGSYFVGADLSHRYITPTRFCSNIACHIQHKDVVQYAAVH